MAVRRKRPHLLRKLFDDHFLLELAWGLNAIHFIFMVIYTAFMCSERILSGDKHHEQQRATSP